MEKTSSFLIQTVIQIQILNSCQYQAAPLKEKYTLKWNLHCIFSLQCTICFLLYSIFLALTCCSSIFSSLNQKTLKRLQTVQNPAARFLTRTKKYDHNTPVLASLHWLPVCFRIDYLDLIHHFKGSSCPGSG